MSEKSSRNRIDITEPVSPTVPEAEIEWRDDGLPRSKVFGDLYFYSEDGLTESEYVFLQHNDLATRWHQLPAHGQFTIVETGFGTGLNFLTAWRLWQKEAPSTCNLHFISLEKYPLGHSSLIRALALWPELAPFVDQLIRQYPIHLNTGVHRLTFDKVHLTLIFAEATAGLQNLIDNSDYLCEPQFNQVDTSTSSTSAAKPSAKIDAWFLDGFAPAKNPDMWHDQLFQAMARLSHKQTSLATYTAAGNVRRRLAAAGFNVAKAPGFGKKREMTFAKGCDPITINNLAATTNSTLAINSSSPQTTSSWMINPQAVVSAGKIAVVGAGIAGCQSARALAERGFIVEVFDRHNQPAQEASGNPQGIVYSKLSPKAGNQGDFNVQSLLYAIQHYQAIWRAHQEYGEQCGVLQLAQSAQQAKQYELIVERFNSPKLVRFVDAKTASGLAGVELTFPGLYFEHAGWLAPAKICQHLLDHTNITAHFSTQILELKAHAEQIEGRQQRHWQLHTAGDQVFGPYSAVVIANANDCQQFAQSAHLPVKPVRGQISQIATSESSRQLKMVLCGDGYIAPAINNSHCIGASFDPKNRVADVLAEDHRHNLELIQGLAPSLIEQSPESIIDGRAALRCTTPDYLPMVGPVADDQAMDRLFAPLRRNAKTAINTPGAYHPGLFVNIGHGSRGLAYTPIAAQILAAHMLNEPFPVNATLKKALHPARFIIRDLTRNRR